MTTSESRVTTHSEQAGGKSLRPEWASVEESLHFAPDASDQVVFVVERQPGRGNGLTDPHADLDRADDGAAFPHRIASAPHGDRDDGGLRMDGHDEAALLEGQQLPGAASSPFRKNEERLP